tara:strand:- start:239 stop:484 length:246 start_codon:yes stop_codon:yes gene_type:complete
MKKTKKRLTIKINEQKEEMSYASAEDREAQKQQQIAQKQQQQRQILIQRINQYMDDSPTASLEQLIKFFHMGDGNWQPPQQ